MIVSGSNLYEFKIIAVHVDNGFLRKNESDAVELSLANFGLKILGVYTYNTIN